MSKIIAISGWKRSGKDTSAEYLITNYGYVRFGFADSLKDLVAEQYQIVRSHCDDPEFKEKPLLSYPVNTTDAFAEVIHKVLIKEFKEVEGKLYWTPRALCILEGSVKRSVDNGYWVEKVIRDIKESGINKAVISDLRYRSEVAQLREAFGTDLVTIRVNRFETSPSNDASERDLDDQKFDYVISNTGSIEDLKTELDIIMEKVCLT